MRFVAAGFLGVVLVAVWLVGEKRLVVPTTDLLLEGEIGLGRTSFDPFRQEIIYPYERNDQMRELSPAMASFLVGQVERYGDWSAERLDALRWQP